jgi:phosphate starvation-inducible PhoH-like protein
MAKKKPDKHDKSPKVHQRDKIEFDITIRERDDLTEKQKELINLILDKTTKVVFIQGPAGTSKTFSAVYAALKLISQKAVSDIIYVRTVVESSHKSMGFLPGSSEDKLGPFLAPLYDKLEEILPAGDIKKLIDNERVKGVSVGHLRGSSFNAKCIICDESQNFDFKELVVTLTRIGKYSKFIFLADPDQVDPGVRTGFAQMYDLFNDEVSRAEGIHCFKFGKEDIVRSPILAFIAEKLEKAREEVKK